MTALDAAVFDITRLGFRNDFFRLIALFGEDEKLPLKTLADYASFDQLRDELIEKQLKSVYVKDVLSILRAAGAGPDRRFVELMELVRRRNLHFHNRGYVDERYLDRDKNGQPQSNIYSLSLGQLAAIDEIY